MTTAKKMMSLFAGMEEAYGTYEESGKVREDGKKEGRSILKREPLTEEIWEKHLTGEQSLGVITIRDDNSCVWGVIDIDDYNLDFRAICAEVDEKDLPLIPMRSKSGGCHLALFLKKALPAKDVQKKLREIASALGFGRSEVFPKQTSVLTERGDVGSWLNMPYFGGDDSPRHALDKTGDMLTLEEFIAIAYKKRVDPEDFSKIVVYKEDGDFKQAPPCIQALLKQGFPQGTRNSGLFSLGVFAKKAFPEEWEKKLEEYNQKHLNPPLDAKEVTTIKEQLKKKEYNYKCSDQPLISFCNSSICSTRRFGVGVNNILPDMSGLVQCGEDEPLYFLDVNGMRLEFVAEELMTQKRFHKKCFIHLGLYPPLVKETVWRDRMQELLDKRRITPVSKEISIAGQFLALLEEFCMDSRFMARSRDEILLGKPFYDPELKLIMFRIQDLSDYLLRHGFKYYTRSQIAAQLIERIHTSENLEKVKTPEWVYKGHKFFNINKKGVNLWWTPMFEGEIIPLRVPDMDFDDNAL